LRKTAEKLSFLKTFINYCQQYSFLVNIEVEKMVKGRCMKCKKQVEIKDPEEVVMKNNMKAAKGTCGTCGTKVFRILGKA